MSWINAGTILKGELVELIPLDESHFEELEFLAREKRIWEFIPIDMSTKEKCFQVFANAITERKKGTEFPFVIFNKQANKIIGSTRLMDIVPEYKKLEIGWTWLHPDYWATSINLECKLLLLTFCFDELKAIRVLLKTDENNIRSRKAIAKTGAQYEGILRNDRIRENGTIRNSVYFSIINSEWSAVRENLMLLLASERKPTAIKSKIEFDNFTARELEINDAEMFYDFILKNKTRIASTAPVTAREITSLETTTRFITNRINSTLRKECISFTLFTNHDNKPIANLIIMHIDWTIPKGEIGYYIGSEYEGKGITTRLVHEICNYAFQHLGFNKLFMRIRNDNEGSKRVAEKNNFVAQGTLHKDYRNNEDQLVDVIYYEKVK